jgi:DNA-binding NarL/FixJ family response regulator
MNYTANQLRRIVESYRELRSVTEFSTCITDSGPKDFTGNSGFEQIVCVLVDVDKAMSTLTPRQREVIALVKSGYSNATIGKKMGVSLSTIKFHIQEAVLRMAEYLNCGQPVKGGTKR